MITFDSKRFIRLSPEDRAAAIEKLRGEIYKASRKPEPVVKAAKKPAKKKK